MLKAGPSWHGGPVVSSGTVTRRNDNIVTVSGNGIVRNQHKPVGRDLRYAARCSLRQSRRARAPCSPPATDRRKLSAWCRHGAASPDWMCEEEAKRPPVC